MIQYLYATKTYHEHFYEQIQMKQLENLSPWPLRGLKHRRESIIGIMPSLYGEYGWMKSTSSAVWSLCLCVCVCLNADLLLITSHHTATYRAWEIQTRQAGIKRLMAEGSPAKNEKRTHLEMQDSGRWWIYRGGERVHLKESYFIWSETLAVQVQVDMDEDSLFKNT